MDEEVNDEMQPLEMAKEPICDECVHGRKITIQRMVQQMPQTRLATPAQAPRIGIAHTHIYACQKFGMALQGAVVGCESFEKAPTVLND